MAADAAAHRGGPTLERTPSSGKPKRRNSARLPRATASQPPSPSTRQRPPPRTLIRNHAGDARAFPSFVGPWDRTRGESCRSRSASPAREALPRRGAEPPREARTDQHHLDAVKRAVEGFRQWWRGGGLFRRKGAGETIVKQVIAAVWPTHWKENRGRARAHHPREHREPHLGERDVEFAVKRS